VGFIVMDRGGARLVVADVVWLAPHVEARVAIAHRGVLIGGPLQQCGLAEVLGVG
jgi:hypothetical protein